VEETPKESGEELEGLTWREPQDMGLEDDAGPMLV
jgi:hypothetical protein